MSLLIDIRMPNWLSDAALCDRLAPLLPDVTIHTGAPDRPLPDVTMLAANRMPSGLAALLPNLALVQKLGAGVESMVNSTELPAHVRIARLEPQVQADEITEYCLAEVFATLRNIRPYLRQQQALEWHEHAPRRAAETRVAVLGLGHIGLAVAQGFSRNGFQVSGWSRRLKTLDNIACFAGPDGLDQSIAAADFVVAVLPSTDATRGLVDARFLAKMKTGAHLVNVGRGDLVVDQDLIAALDKGQLSGASLDVFNHEPLSQDHGFWVMENVAITPHVSGWSLGDGVLDVAENYRRLMAGKPLLREIDRALGY
jgi:glyoxylate/hydroxypyruvate reductase